MKIKKPTLIPEWRKGWRFWSTRLTSLGLVLLSFIEVFPNVAISAWTVLPLDIRSEIPSDYVRWTGYIIILFGIIARFIRQEKLHNTDPLGNKGNPDIQG